MKLSHIIVALKRIIGNRNFQLSVILFFVGLVLVSISTYPVLTEYIREDTLDEGAHEKIDVEYDSGSLLTPLGNVEILENATLEFESDEETKANITMLKEDGTEIRCIEISGKENEEINLNSPRYNDLEYLGFEIREGNLSYTYSILYSEQPYRYFSIVGLVMMGLSLLFFFRFLALVNIRNVGEKERGKKRKNMKTVEEILKERKDK